MANEIGEPTMKKARLHTCKGTVEQLVMRRKDRDRHRWAHVINNPEKIFCTKCGKIIQEKQLKPGGNGRCPGMK